MPLVTSPTCWNSALVLWLVRPKAIMQSPSAMHVRARWRDTRHSQIYDESLARVTERERWEEIGRETKENQCMYMLATCVIRILRGARCYLQRKKYSLQK